MLEAAIDHYHRLLDPDTAQASHEQLTSVLRDRGLYFGDRPLATVLRPRMMSAEQYALLGSACGLVASAARKLGQAMLSDATLRAGVGLTPIEERLIAMHPGYDEPSAHSRMDTFLTLDGRSLQFVEYNAESPAAIAYEDSLSEVFLDLPVMRRFAEQYTAHALPARRRLLDTLLEAYRPFGRTATPMIAILDWSGLPTHSEFVLFQRYFHEQGYESIICTPDDLVFRDGRLFARAGTTSTPHTGDVPIDIVYKRVLSAELIMRYGQAIYEHPVVQAYAAGAICMVNSFRAKLLHKKAIFALLTDESLQGDFTPEERAAVARHVPWTRMVRSGQTTYQNQSVDLLEFARTHQERLLLKPNDEYGGKGIVIGWETDENSWNAALREATESPFVVQERVEIAYEDYPAYVDGQLQIGRRLVDSDPFLFGSDVQGCLTRLSTVTLLNVTAGGGSSIPTFVIEPRA